MFTTGYTPSCHAIAIRFGHVSTRCIDSLYITGNTAKAFIQCAEGVTDVVTYFDHLAFIATMVKLGWLHLVGFTPAYFRQ